MKTIAAILLGICATLFARAQTNPPIRLWTNDAPGALGSADKDIPTLTPFFADPAMATGAAMVILPGGGYQHLADHEGRDYALWLADHGVSGFVLKYRLGSAGYHHPVMLEDAARAVRLIRAQAAEWKLDPKRVGIMGSSAGGHLAATLLTHFDKGNPAAQDPVERQSSRPDLGILCYAVITMGDESHKGSREMLLGKDPSPELILLLSNEKQVTKETPPCFIFSTADDSVVPVANSLEFAAALSQANVPFDLHIYEHGKHGGGLGGYPGSKYDPAKLHPWTADCLYWLKKNSFIADQAPSKPRLTEQEVLKIAKDAILAKYPNSLAGHEPYHAEFKQGVWSFGGSAPPGTFGGGAPEAEIRDSDGKVLKVYLAR